MAEISFKSENFIGPPWCANSTKDAEASERHTAFQISIFADPVFITGDWPKTLMDTLSPEYLPHLTEEEKKDILSSADFFTIDAYHVQPVRAPPDGLAACVSNSSHPNWPVCNVAVQFNSTMGWSVSAVADWLVNGALGSIQSMPTLMRPFFREQKRWPTNKMYISEFGFIELFEQLRTEVFQITENVTQTNYHMTYVGEVLKAIHEDKLLIKGLIAWAMLNNAEWNLGLTARFGIQHVNYTMLERTFKRSTLSLSCDSGADGMFVSGILQETGDHAVVTNELVEDAEARVNIIESMHAHAHFVPQDMQATLNALNASMIALTQEVRLVRAESANSWIIIKNSRILGPEDLRPLQKIVPGTGFQLATAAAEGMGLVVEAYVNAMANNPEAAIGTTPLPFSGLIEGYSHRKAQLHPNTIKQPNNLVCFICLLVELQWLLDFLQGVLSACLSLWHAELTSQRGTRLSMVWSMALQHQVSPGPDPRARAKGQQPGRPSPLGRARANGWLALRPQVEPGPTQFSPIAEGRVITPTPTSVISLPPPIFRLLHRRPAVISHLSPLPLCSHHCRCRCPRPPSPFISHHRHHLALLPSLTIVLPWPSPCPCPHSHCRHHLAACHPHSPSLALVLPPPSPPPRLAGIAIPSPLPRCSHRRHHLLPSPLPSPSLAVTHPRPHPHSPSFCPRTVALVSHSPSFRTRPRFIPLPASLAVALVSHPPSPQNVALVSHHRQPHSPSLALVSPSPCC
ncbi:unnamed protein product [Cyclocybe aegerita]|uniref:Uncharacterized protein n=1 Tax=Cyclocybe aegerita TaxID=1973307 RepID=A0A8S0VV21_CYCAE|nr:unnamed protein product [Cyclocybe aegerita]